MSPRASRKPEPVPLPAPMEDRPLAAIGFVLMALLLFSAMDAISKLLVQEYSPFLITWGRYGVNLLLLLPFVLRAGVAPMGGTGLAMQVGRGIAMVGSAVLFVSGLSHLQLADAIAISFVSPLLVTALSIPFLGERVGIRRWSAVVVGFIGILIIIQPGTSAFDVASLFPLASSTCWAFGLVLTRRIGSAAPPMTTLLYTTAVAFLILCLFLPWVWQPLGGRALLLVATMGVLSTISQYFILMGYMRGPASLLAPFSFLQIISSTFWGVVLFGAWPGISTWIGAAVVVASGLYVFHRERVTRKG
ncbi:MAG TPA: DMT family transporter [Stellaceae bacterium]|nr:DMT family transporter [Stellaceae bacterium]